MKKILLYLFILVAPAIIVFLGLNFAYKQTNHWKSEYYNSDSRFNNVPSGIKLCNVGTSHSCWGLKWEDYPELHAFNFGNTSQPFYMDLIMLKHFETKIERGAVVLIPISFHQIYTYWQQGYSVLYYCFLNKKEYPFWDTKSYITKRVFPILEKPTIIKYIKNDITKDKIDRFYSEDRWAKYLSEEKMKAYTDEHLPQWIFAGFQKDAYCWNFDEVVKIVDYCHEHDWKPVFITLPVYKYFYESFSSIAPVHKEGFYKFSADLAEKYPDIPYLDYSNDEDFSPYIELFMDDNHLNITGAEKFTLRVIKDLIKISYLD